MAAFVSRIGSPDEQHRRLLRVDRRAAARDEPTNAIRIWLSKMASNGQPMLGHNRPNVRLDLSCRRSCRSFADCSSDQRYAPHSKHVPDKHQSIG